MNTGLSGSVALVTGGASGIGLAIAEALLAEGAQVVIADLNSEQASIQAQRIGARAIACDVGDEASVAQAVAASLAISGRLDVLVNNAGIGSPPAPLIRTTVEDWDRVYRVNLRGVFLGTKHAALAMIERGSGSIINIASVAGLAGSPSLSPYGATKAAVVNLTQTAALELAKSGVRVNAICPGWIETPILGEFDRAQLARQVPMAHLGVPQDVASLAVYLASSAAGFVTGSVFRVDGGMRS